MKYVFIISTLLTNILCIAQNEVPLFPVASPGGRIAQTVGNTEIAVEYERPLARKRKIFGDLVPWNQIWRTGAGASTKLTFSRSVMIEGQKVPAGRYSLFTIPNQDAWVFIINSDTTLYGSYAYSQAKDIARFLLTPAFTERYYEALTIDIDIRQSNARLYVSWANTQLHFDVVTTTAIEAMKFIEEQLLTGKHEKSDAYFEAAQFLLFERTHLMEALKLADKAIAINKQNGGARRVKVEIYEYLRLYNESLTEISRAIEMEKSKQYEKETDRLAEIKYWQSFQKRIKNQQAGN